jgi:hypothetical protein
MNKERNKKHHKIRWYILGGIGLLLVVFIAWQEFKKPPLTGDWQPALAVLSSADFNGNLVTVHNVRNFRYDGSEANPIPSYYDKTYDLNKLTKVWYITDPFKGLSIAAHTFVSFEFSNGDYLSISIEARKVKRQTYNLFWGMLHTYPLMYIAADEHDTVFVRANIDRDDLYMYPVKLQDSSHAKLLLTDMLEKMNSLAVKPEWYNTITANCTSQIAYHINKLFPGRLPRIAWQTQLSGYADALALKQGILDTNLPLEQARKKYYITTRSQEVEYVPNYSVQIRQFNNP